MHVSNDVKISYAYTSTGVQHAHFLVPKTKTHQHGEVIHLTAIDDRSSPINILLNHLYRNEAVAAGAPLFAFKTHSGWSSLTKPLLLSRCSEIWSHSNLDIVTGHAFRIGGTTELLLRGVNPDVVMAQGRWKSKAFLEYWRRIDEILPLFISNTFADRIPSLRSSMDSFPRRHNIRARASQTS